MNELSCSTFKRACSLKWTICWQFLILTNIGQLIDSIFSFYSMLCSEPSSNLMISHSSSFHRSTLGSSSTSTSRLILRVGCVAQWIYRHQHRTRLVKLIRSYEYSKLHQSSHILIIIFDVWFFAIALSVNTHTKNTHKHKFIHEWSITTHYSMSSLHLNHKSSSSIKQPQVRRVDRILF